MQNNQNAQVSSGFEAGVLYIAIMIGAIVLLWHLNRRMVVALFLGVDKTLIALPALVFDRAKGIRFAIGMLGRNPKSLAFADLMMVTNDTIRYYMPIYLGLCGYGFYTTFTDLMSKLSSYRVSHTAKTLLHKLNIVFPYTTPILDLDLNFSDDPAWASSLPPYLLAKELDLVKDGKFDRQAARKFYEEQIGREFHIGGLAPHEKALYAIFAARIGGAVDESMAVLDALAKGSRKGPPDFALAVDLFNKHKREGLPFTKVHKYTTTVLCSMFEASKLRGKIAPSFFLWLKPLDRMLWYALNRVGAQTPFPLAAGIWDCWKAEQVAFTGKGAINWLDFLQEDELTGELVWETTRAEYVLNGVWVENAVHALEQNLMDSGVVTGVLPERR